MSVSLFRISVGQSNDASKTAGRPLKYLRQAGYAGRIYPINPRLPEIRGVPCFPNLKSLPEVPDHVGIVLPATAVPAALEECVKKGVPFATVFSAGFGEQGTDEGRRAQARAVAIAREGGLRFMGPNCNGLINFVDAFALTSTSAMALTLIPVYLLQTCRLDSSHPGTSGVERP